MQLLIEIVVALKSFSSLTFKIYNAKLVLKLFKYITSLVKPYLTIANTFWLDCNSKVHTVLFGTLVIPDGAISSKCACTSLLQATRIKCIIGIYYLTVWLDWIGLNVKIILCICLFFNSLCMDKMYHFYTIDCSSVSIVPPFKGTFLHMYVNENIKLNLNATKVQVWINQELILSQ